MLIFHVPHASVVIPKEHRNEFVLSDQELTKEAHIMADLYTDKLVEELGGNALIFPVSRLVCDVERFREDSKNDLFKRGMAAVYTKTHDLHQLRGKHDAEKIKQKFYDSHHKAFTAKVAEHLEKFERCIIIDMHSYADKALPYELHSDQQRPDICLGFEPFHMELDVVEKIAQLCTEYGYTVAFNEPFAGSIVPLDWYQKDARVRSLMIEINKRVYLDGFELIPKRFTKLKELVNKIAQMLTT